MDRNKCFLCQHEELSKEDFILCSKCQKKVEEEGEEDDGN